VIEAGKVAVGLLRAAYDDDNKFSREGTRVLLEPLTATQLTHLAAVQTVWMLEQMEWIARSDITEGETLSVDEQIEGLGMEVALNEVGPA
jgi:hypothetical protein